MRPAFRIMPSAKTRHLSRDEVLTAHIHLKGPLLPILHTIQTRFGCIPRMCVGLLAHADRSTANLSRSVVQALPHIRRARQGS